MEEVGGEVMLKNAFGGKVGVVDHKHVLVTPLFDVMKLDLIFKLF